MSEPYYEASGNNAKVTKGVTEDMKNKCAHVHCATTMTMSVPGTFMLAILTFPGTSSLGGYDVPGVLFLVTLGFTRRRRFGVE